jgi:hypothetical protein
VKKIRGLTDSYNKNDRDLIAEYQTNYLATRTTERQSITDEWKKKSAEAYDSTVRNFKTKLLSESKAVRAELHRRLPERLHRPNLLKIYENPSSVMEMQIIADDLELLSKSLPDTWSLSKTRTQPRSANRCDLATSKHEPRHNDSSAPLEDPGGNSRGFYAGSEKRAAATTELSFHEGRDPVAPLAHYRFLELS